MATELNSTDLRCKSNQISLWLTPIPTIPISLRLRTQIPNPAYKGPVWSCSYRPFSGWACVISSSHSVHQALWPSFLPPSLLRASHREYTVCGLASLPATPPRCPCPSPLNSLQDSDWTFLHHCSPSYHFSHCTLPYSVLWFPAYSVSFLLLLNRLTSLLNTLRGLKPHTFMLWQFWRSEAQS